jgi:uncharacterized phage protein (TIGR02218 family)
MAALLRQASPALAAALAGGAPLWGADIFAVTTLAGGPTLTWCAWDRDLTVDGVVYASKAPWLERSSWNVANTLQVPTLTVRLRALDDGFAGGANIKAQIVGGLLDGAGLLFSRVFMTAPGAATALGALPLFGGKIAGVEIVGSTATLSVKGKVNDLDQTVPRNLYQVGCNHAFCDAGCALSRAAFTAAFAVGAAPTAAFIPWSGAAPAGAASYQNGTLTFTGGAAAGQSRTIAQATAAGLLLAYPLYAVPAPGDPFTAFQGCDKTFNSGSGQSCTDRGNTLNFRGFPFVPPPNSAY